MRLRLCSHVDHPHCAVLRSGSIARMTADDNYGLDSVRMASSGRKKRRRLSRAQHGGAADITRTVLEMQLGGSSRRASASYSRGHPQPTIGAFDLNGGARGDARWAYGVVPMPFAVMGIAASSLAKGSTRSVGVDGVHSRANITTCSTSSCSPMTVLEPSHMLTVPDLWLEPSHLRCCIG